METDLLWKLLSPFLLHQDRAAAASAALAPLELQKQLAAFTIFRHLSLSLMDSWANDVVKICKRHHVFCNRLKSNCRGVQRGQQGIVKYLKVLRPVRLSSRTCPACHVGTIALAVYCAQGESMMWSTPELNLFCLRCAPTCKPDLAYFHQPTVFMRRGCGPAPAALSARHEADTARLLDL
jgi:hypothetical protein